MRFKAVPTIIAVAISLLIAYAMFSFATNEDKRLMVAIVEGLMAMISLTFILGVEFDKARKGAIIKSVSTICFFETLVINLIFCFIKFGNPLFIIINGLNVLAYIYMLHKLSKTSV